MNTNRLKSGRQISSPPTPARCALDRFQMISERNHEELEIVAGGRIATLTQLTYSES